MPFFAPVQTMQMNPMDLFLQQLVDPRTNASACHPRKSQPTPGPCTRPTKSCHTPSHSHLHAQRQMYLDVTESTEGYELVLEAPGYKKEQLTMALSGEGMRVLQIDGKVVKPAPGPAPITDAPDPKEEGLFLFLILISVMLIDALVVDAGFQKITIEDDEDDHETSSQSSATVSEKAQSSIVPAATPKATATEGPKEEITRQFSRQITFDKAIDHQKVSADLADGILTLSLPKLQIPAPFQITF